MIVDNILTMPLDVLTVFTRACHFITYNHLGECILYKCLYPLYIPLTKFRKVYPNFMCAVHHYKYNSSECHRGQHIFSIYSFKPNKPGFSKLTNKEVDILGIHFNIIDMLNYLHINFINTQQIIIMETYHLFTEPTIKFYFLHNLDTGKQHITYSF